MSLTFFPYLTNFVDRPHECLSGADVQHFFSFIVSFKFSIELYRFPRTHRKIELYLPTWGGGRCTVIAINEDNGSHSAHEQRQTGQEGREGCEIQRGRGGGRDAVRCASVRLNEDKSFSHTSPPNFEIKKTKQLKSSKLPPYPTY